MVILISHLGVFNDNSLWYHDRQMGKNWTYKKKINEVDVGELEYCQEQSASLLMYTQV